MRVRSGGAAPMGLCSGRGHRAAWGLRGQIEGMRNRKHLTGRQGWRRDIGPRQDSRRARPTHSRCTEASRLPVGGRPGAHDSIQSPVATRAHGYMPGGAWQGHLRPPQDPAGEPVSGCFLLLSAASFISPEKSRKMLPTPSGTHSGTSLLGPSLLDGNSRDSFVSRSLADVAEVGAWP